MHSIHWIFKCIVVRNDWSNHSPPPQRTWTKPWVDREVTTRRVEDRRGAEEIEPNIYRPFGYFYRQPVYRNRLRNQPNDNKRIVKLIRIGCRIGKILIPFLNHTIQMDGKTDILYTRKLRTDKISSYRESDILIADVESSIVISEDVHIPPLERNRATLVHLQDVDSHPVPSILTLLNVNPL